MIDPVDAHGHAHDHAAARLAAVRHRDVAGRRASRTSRSKRRGQLLKLDTTSYAQTGSAVVGPNPRHLSISGDGARLYVSRFVTPPLPGEGTATVTPTASTGGEVLQLDTASLALRAHDRAAAQRQARRRDPGPRHAELSRRRGDLARRHAGLGAVEAGQRQARHAARRHGAQLPEHRARDQLAHRPRREQPRTTPRASTTTTPASPARRSTTRAASTCSSRSRRAARWRSSTRSRPLRAASASTSAARRRASRSRRTA